MLPVMPTGRVANLYEAFLKKTPRQSRSRGAVEAILTAALQGLSRTGDESTVTVQEVAERAGVGIGSLYDYFRDRRSLLASLAAKITEDNLRRFEEVLERTRDLALEPAVSLIVGFAFDTYATDPRMPRAVLRIAHGVGLMPVLAASQDAFAASLAEALRARGDVHVRDVDAAAFVLTNAVMGVVHTLIWQDEPTRPRDAIRASLVDFCCAHLTRDQAGIGPMSVTS